MENNEEVKVNNVESNTNENKPKKNNNGKTVILIIVAMIVVLVIGIGGGFLLASKDKSDNNVNQTEQKNVDKQEQTKVSKKLDESKDWVYDADYLKSKEEKKINAEYSNETYSTINKLKIPYINVNSDEAQKANQEIEKIATEQYNLFGKKDGEYTYYITSMDYLYSYNGDNLSILVCYDTSISGTGARINSLKSYNIKINNQNNEDKDTIGGYSQEEVKSKIDEFSKKENSEGDKLEMVEDGYFIYNNQLYVICTGGYTSGGIRSSNQYTLFDVNNVKEIPYYQIKEVLGNKESSQNQITSNNNSSTTSKETTSIQDFSIMKNAGFANTVYETEKKQGEMFYRISFDSNCNPTIYSEAVGIQPYATYNKFYNIKYDVAAGTTYITFDYKLLNETENGGKGEIKYSNVADNTFISIKLNYPPTEEYIELQKVTTSNNTSTKNTASQSKGYAKYYIEKIKQLDFVNDSTKYGLLYINQSDIPYLVVDTGGGLSIYKINNNTVETLKERDSYGTHGRDGYDYIEGTKIMRDYCTFEEGYAYEIYDELFDYKYCVECTFNGEYRYSNNSGEKKTITEEEFNNLSYKNSKFKHLRNIANKNKEEMIKFLENQ